MVRAMIELKELTRKFADKAVVDRMNLSVQAGTFFGLLGPNGAGKTTTLRMMTTLLRPTSGQILIDGKDLTRDQLDFKRKIGMVAQHISLENEMTAEENLQLHARLHKMSKKVRDERIQELLEFVELSEHQNKQIRMMSGGMKRRVMIARSILHRPSILFLDEPTVGLDPNSRRKIWDLLKDLNQDGLTVFMTTHYIEEAEMLCDDVALMDCGKIIDRGSPAELKDEVGEFVLEIFKDGKTEYKFFKDRERGLEFANQVSGKVTLRKSCLEDVFVKLTDHGVGE